MAPTDEVRLTVPALPEFLRLTRVTAAGLASRLGFSFDEVEDLRLAIDEMCYGLTGAGGQPGTVQVRYVMSPGVLVVEGEGHFDAASAASTGLEATRVPTTEVAGDPDNPRVEPSPDRSELSEVILNALVDEHGFGQGAHGPTFRLVKRVAGRSGRVEGPSVSGGASEGLG